MNPRLAILLLIIPVTTSLLAQDYPQKDVNLEVLADEIFGFQDLDLNYQELYENMALLLANKINLNTASAEELRFLNLLTEQQVQSLLEYRTEAGALLSVYELQAVPGFDLSTISKIVAFVKVENAESGTLWKRILSEENNYLIVRYHQTLETKQGFMETETPARKFKGDDGDLYLRFRVSKAADFSLGFTLEKDAGEQIIWNTSGKQYGFDFMSVHAQVMNNGILKNFIMGDYQTQFAQGLLLGGSFGYGKGSEAVMTVRRSNLGFLPYTSANETGFKRGAAATLELTRYVYVSGFYSNALRDASITRDTLDEFSSASSFQTTGLHRNAVELATRHKIREQNYGAILNFKRGSIDAGIIFNAVQYSIPVDRDPRPYSQFSFEGRQLSHAGAFMNYTFHNFTFFAEAAQTLHEGYGITAGLLGSLTPKLDIALHIRSYQRNFYSPYSNAFSENSTPQNESGMYWGWKYRWNKKISASGYADLFVFPWLRYRSYAPSSGHEWLLRFNYQPSRNVTIFIQAREESKARNTSAETNFYETFTGTKRNYWINFDYPVSDKIQLKTRAQFSTYDFDNASSKGMAILQDISIDLGKLNLTGRYTIFDTENYDNRQYVYERDVWLMYSLPAYDGKGVRSYIVAEYSFTRKFTVWLRYAHTRYTDRDEMGSGVDTISGNERNDIRIQTRIKF